jgi:hypothetical protein
MTTKQPLHDSEFNVTQLTSETSGIPYLDSPELCATDDISMMAIEEREHRRYQDLPPFPGGSWFGG